MTTMNSVYNVPDNLSQSLPLAIREQTQFCLWQSKKREGKTPAKLPLFFRDGKFTSKGIDDPNSYVTLEQAVRSKSVHYNNSRGIGFVTLYSNLFVIDLDNISLGPQFSITGEEVRNFLAAFPCCYIVNKVEDQALYLPL